MADQRVNGIGLERSNLLQNLKNQTFIMTWIGLFWLNDQEKKPRNFCNNCFVGFQIISPILFHLGKDVSGNNFNFDKRKFTCRKTQ